jgi:hypothetical protein
MKKIFENVFAVIFLALMPFVSCETPTDAPGGPGTGASVNGWAALASALENPAVREINIASGSGHIIADRAVSMAGQKTLRLSPHTALTLKGLTLNDDLTVAYDGRIFSGAAYLTVQGKVSVPAERTFLIGKNVTCNINDASITVRGLLAFESGDSLPGNTYAVIGGSGKVSLDYDEEYDYQNMFVIPAEGLLLQNPLDGTLAALPTSERKISISHDSLVIVDAVTEGETPSTFRTVQITNEGYGETGVLEASVADPYLEFDGGASTLAIDSISVRNDAEFRFRIKSGLEAGIYRTEITVSGSGIPRSRWKSFPVIFEVRASGGSGISSLQALSDYLKSGSGTLSKPLNVRVGLNLMYWPGLLEILDQAGDYVSLDLSDCTPSALTESTAFNPDSSISAGKDLITSLTLPEAVGSITGGAEGAPAFGGFTRLVHLEGLNVGSVGDYCFTDCSTLTEVDLPALGSAGSYAFSRCSALREISLPALVTIMSYAFSGCSALEVVDLPLLNSIIGDCAFSGCSSLETIELPALVSMTAQSVYYGYPYCAAPLFLNGTSLRSISLPSATRICSDAFTGCTNLESVTFGSVPPSLVNVESFYIDGTMAGNRGPRHRNWLQGCATTAKTITFYVPATSFPAYLSAWDGAISTTGMSNSNTTFTSIMSLTHPFAVTQTYNDTWNYVWDDNEATRGNLTVRLAAAP